jgi:hypothetical protein
MTRGREEGAGEAERQGRLVDWWLGEAGTDAAGDPGPEERSDPAGEQQAGERQAVGRLFAGLRELCVLPTGRVGVQVRYHQLRQARLRRRCPSGDAASDIRLFDFSCRVAAVALVTLGVLFGTRALFLHTQGSPQTDSQQLAGLPGDDLPEADLLEADLLRLPGSESHFPSPPLSVPREREPSLPGEEEGEAIAPVPGARDRDRPLPTSLSGDARWMHHYESLVQVEAVEEDAAWLHALNGLATLRREFRSRFNPVLRRAAIRCAGGSHLLESRIDALVGEVASLIDAALLADEASLQDVSLSLRALVAGGSSLRQGAHTATVRRCSEHLLARLEGLSGGRLATALSGLIDVAIISDRRIGHAVGYHAGRLVDDAFDEWLGHRPSLLNWQTPVGELADCGQVMRLAPAFGVDAARALRVRRMVAAHLSERIAATTAEHPELLAAQLYGFGDLVDCRSLEFKLMLWRARDLVPEHYVALMHIAWSRFPVREGWADFQRQLRTVSVEATPSTAGDAAALLLCLAMNFAAPGSEEILELAQY